MSPRNGKSRPSDKAATPITTHSHPENSRRSSVWGVGYPPSGHRRYWLVAVLCPNCRGWHSHRTGPNGGLRRAGCGRGAYLIKVRRPLASVGRRAA